MRPGDEPLGWDGLGQRSSLFVLDAALEYVRARPGRVAPAYALAMAPFTLAMLLVIDVVASQNRGALGLACLLLAAATGWRWVGLAVVQRQVQADIRGTPPLRLRGRLGAILGFRLAANFALTWGGLIIVPAFYGWFLGGLAAPLLLEQEGPAFGRMRAGWGLLQRAGKRLTYLALAYTVLVLLALAVTIVLHLALLEYVLPTLVGGSIVDLELTLRSPAWWMAAGYLLFLLADFYWTVAAAILLYDLQARRQGSDLRRRLQAVREAQA